MQMDLWYTLVAGEVGELNERQEDLLREAKEEGAAVAALAGDDPEVVAVDFF